jgi:hypothetical protein
MLVAVGVLRVSMLYGVSSHQIIQGKCYASFLIGSISLTNASDALRACSSDWCVTVNRQSIRLTRLVIRALRQSAIALLDK